MNEVVLKYKGDPQFKGYYDTFMECLWDVADEATQTKEWKLGDHDLSIVFTYDEVNEEFTNFAETIFAIYKEVGFSESQLELIRKIYFMVENYNGSTEERDEEGWVMPKTDAQIADDPEWHKIRDYAKYVYKELNKDQ